MRSKKRSEQMKKRLDKVSGEKFYFKIDLGCDNGETIPDNFKKFNSSIFYIIF